MSLAVENIRRKQVKWVRDIMAAKNWNISQLAKAANVNQSTISKFLNDPVNIANLNTTTVSKIEAATGATNYQTGSILKSRGYLESEAEPYISFNPIIDSAIAALSANIEKLEPWILRSNTLLFLGYLPGDVLLVNLNEPPKDGDIVCVQIHSLSGSAETAFRIYDKPFLITAGGDASTRKPILIDSDFVLVRGVVVTSLRPRLAA